MRTGRAATRRTRSVAASAADDGHQEVVDADLSDYLDPSSYCPQAYEECSNRVA